MNGEWGGGSGFREFFGKRRLSIRIFLSFHSVVNNSSFDRLNNSSYHELICPY